MKRLILRMLSGLVLAISISINSTAIAIECVSPEIAERITSAIDESHKLFTSGRYFETQVLERTTLKLVNGIPLGKPELVHDSVNKGIKARLARGDTNLDLMKAGKAPIGSDGKQMNLHHLFGEEPGPMAEMLASEHQVNHKVLHQMIERSFRHDYELEKSYTRFRREYWKARAAELQP